jgi:hypothetical protein
MFFMLKLELTHMLIVRVNQFESPLLQSISFVLEVVVVKVDILQLQSAIPYNSRIKRFHIFISLE